MKTIKVLDTQWGEDPDDIKKALFEIGKDLNLNNDSYFSVTPEELEHEHALKNVADYFRAQGVGEKEIVLVLYWW